MRTRIGRITRSRVRKNSRRAPPLVSKTDWISRLVEVSTLLVIATGLWFTWDQTRQLNISLEINNQNNNLATWSTVSSLTIEVDKVMVERPELSPYIFASKQLLKTDTNFERAMAVGTLYLDYFDSVLSLLKYMDRGPDPRLRSMLERGAWENYFQQTFKTSPLLCEMLKEAWLSYGSEIKRIGGPACGLRQDGRTATPP